MSEPRRILVVDDNTQLRDAILYDLKKRGYEAQGAASGNQALRRLEEADIDLVLSDFRMPDGDGMELLDALRARNPTRPGFFLVSGFADMALEDVYARGADAVFSKPYDRAEFFASVACICSPFESRWLKAPEPAPGRLLELSFGTRVQALEQGKLRLGRGGFTAALPRETQPRVDEQLRFKIRFLEEPSLNLEGAAKVRWIRQESCGLEWLQLEGPGREAYRKYLSETGLIAHIPLIP
jgi:CheY-like chemotaxis protein